MPRFFELEGGRGVEQNVTFWINGITIAKGWLITCGLQEFVLDDDLQYMELLNQKLCQFGYITIDSTNFWWTLSLVIVCVLQITQWVIEHWIPLA
jgi:hypothetical protein